MYAQFERFEIQMTKTQALSASRPGVDASEDVAYLLTDPKIARQIKRIPPDKLREELREYGAWDDEELADDEANARRIVWIAANDISDELP